MFPFIQQYLDIQAEANSVDPDQILQAAASDLGPHCLLLIQQFFDTPTCSKMSLFKFLDKFGKQFRCPNIYGIYAVIATVVCIQTYKYWNVQW